MPFDSALEEWLCFGWFAVSFPLALGWLIAQIVNRWIP